MDVKEAIRLAKTHLQEIFAEERIQNLGLEEVEYDENDKVWSITLGFSRPWDTDPATIATAFRFNRKRDYKVVRIFDPEKKIISINNREVVE
jgi:hypothetical protein